MAGKSSLLLLAVLFWCTQLSGQGKALQQLTYVPPALVNCKPEASFSSSVVLVNNGGDTIRLTQLPFENPFFIQIQALHRPILIAPYDSVRVPFRFINKLGKINGLYKLSVRLQSDAGELTAIDFPVQMTSGMNPRVFAEVLQEQIFVLPGTSEIKVPVRLRSYLPPGSAVWLEMTRPNPDFQLQQPSFSLRLPQLRDTVLELTFMRTRQKADHPVENGPILVHFRGEAGNELASLSILPQMLYNTRSFYEPEKPRAGLQVAAAMTTTQDADLQTELSLGYAPTGTEGLSWQLNYLQFAQAGFRQLYATWLHYQNQHTKVQLGSINDFHELNFQGRGVTVEQVLPAQKLRLTGWWVDNNPNLLTPYRGGPAEQITSTRLVYSGFTGGDLSVSSSWFDRRSSFSRGSLQFFSWQPSEQKKAYLAIKLGTSQESFYVVDTAIRGYSLQLQGRVNTRMGSWYAHSVYNTPSYAGNQRGVMGGTIQGSLLNTAKLGLGVRWNLNTFKIPPAFRKIIGEQHMVNQTFELQTSVRLKQAVVNIRPYYLKQVQQTPVLITRRSISSDAFNLSVSGNRSFAGIGVGLNWDGGLMQTTTEGKDKTGSFTWRSAVNLNWRKLSFSSAVQQGGYYIWQQQLASDKMKPFKNISFSGAYNHTFNKKTSFYINSFAARNNLMQYWQLSVTSQLNYTIKDWKITGSALLNAGAQTFVQFRTGIMRSFAVSARPKDVVSLRIRLFKDVNSNKVHDEGEPWLADQLVQVNETMMITNKEGLLYISSIKKGSVSIRVLAKERLHAPLLVQKIDLQEKALLPLGVPPLFTIYGKVVAREDRFTGKTETVGNIRITLKNGSEEQNAYTQADGTFVFTVPAGVYQVFISQLKNRPTAETRKEITVDPQQGYTGPLELVWTAGERPVQVKKVKIQ